MIWSGTLKAEEISKGKISGSQTNDNDTLIKITRMLHERNVAQARELLCEQYTIENDKIHLKMDPTNFTTLHAIIQLEDMK